MAEADIKSIVSVVREVVRGYYVMIFSDTRSYKVCKLQKEEFINIFKEGNWVAETRDELTRFLLTSPGDTATSESEMLNTFCTYTLNGETRIASQTVVCDWGVYEMVFDGKSPENWLKSVTTEKN